jgi:hypothetical protein
MAIKHPHNLDHSVTLGSKVTDFRRYEGIIHMLTFKNLASHIWDGRKITL